MTEGSKRRGARANNYNSWYGTTQWRAIRKRQLAAEPLCRMCLADGAVTAATVCDHIEPHRGDRAKFFAGPFQSLCKPHHSGAKQREDLAGFSDAVDLSGFPKDPLHPFNRVRR